MYDWPMPLLADVTQMPFAQQVGACVICSVVSTCKIADDVPTGSMGIPKFKIVGFRAANEKSADSGMSKYEVPFGLSPQQTLQDWTDISTDRRFPYVEFDVAGHKLCVLVCPQVDIVDDNQGTVLCSRHQLPLMLGYGMTVH